MTPACVGVVPGADSASCELVDARSDFFAPAQPVASREAQP
jgi:hypothetical protein